jgi:hypothetical protein
MAEGPGVYQLCEYSGQAVKHFRYEHRNLWIVLIFYFVKCGVFVFTSIHVGVRLHTSGLSERDRDRMGENVRKFRGNERERERQRERERWVGVGPSLDS